MIAVSPPPPEGERRLHFAPCAYVRFLLLENIERAERVNQAHSLVDGKGQTENQLGDAKEDRVGDQLAKIKRFEEGFEMLETYPGTSLHSLECKKIFKGNLGIVDWDIAKNEVIGER